MKKTKVDVNPTPEADNAEQIIVEEASADTAPEVTSEAAVEDSSAAAIAELTNDLQRTRADFENYRKQVELQKSQAMSAAKYATVTKFLPLVDDISRAIDVYSEQLAPLKKSFEKTLSSLGLAQIESQPGTEFNPDFHEAISVEDDEGETEVIAETLRPGYMYDGAVIRAAMVKVKHQ